MVRVLWVALGGALGSVARYLVALGMTRLVGTGFPAGTLVVNVVGSFAIGMVAASKTLSGDLRVFLMTGVMGGFTTYSAFNEETLSAFRAGHAGVAAVNVAVTVVACLAAGLAGAAVGTAVMGQAPR